MGLTKKRRKLKYLRKSRVRKSKSRFRRKRQTKRGGAHAHPGPGGAAHEEGLDKMERDLKKDIDTLQIELESLNMSKAAMEEQIRDAKQKIKDGEKHLISINHHISLKRYIIKEKKRPHIDSSKIRQERIQQLETPVPGETEAEKKARLVQLEIAYQIQGAELLESGKDLRNL